MINMVAEQTGMVWKGFSSLMVHQKILLWAVQGKTECLHRHHPCLHFSTWLLSPAESWPVNKVSQRATVHGSSQQQEWWDRDESRPCPVLQLSARISPRLIPLHVWLQQGHDLQRSQILQVSPVINQSNMSWVLSLWPSPQQFTHRALIASVDIPHCASMSTRSSRGCKMVCKQWPSASHHHRARHQKTRAEK